MAYQSGETPVGVGDTTVAVAFPAPFDATPAIVIAVVQNQVDNPQLKLNAQVTAKDDTGFTVELDGTPDSANYELAWIAGDAELVFQTVTKIGTRIADLPRNQRELRANDTLVAVQDGATRRIPFREFQSAFALKAAIAPGSAGASGVPSQVIVTDDALYARGPSRWLRIPYTGHPLDWGIPAHLSARPALCGREALTEGAASVSVVYDHQFPSDGPAPCVVFALANTANFAPSAIGGNVTASSLSGFTVTFSMPLDADGWTLDWYAIQP